MASTRTPRELMSALIEQRPPTRRSQNVHAVDNGDVQYITSYGDHFVISYRSGDSWWVTDAKYSATTSTHQRGIREALRDHGFEPTGIRNKAGYERWSR